MPVKLGAIAVMNDLFRLADDLGPAKVIHVLEPAIGLKAVLVVDNVARGPSIGGLRMAPDVSSEECARLARAMTLKNSAAGLAHGGGKSVLTGDPRMPLAGKERLIRAFEANAEEDLAERLMRAVELGRDAGGQPEGQNSAALVVYGREPYALVDLRVDLHDTPDAELRRLWDWYGPMVPYYAGRAVSANLPRWWQWRMENVPGWTARHLLKKKA